MPSNERLPEGRAMLVQDGVAGDVRVTELAGPQALESAGFGPFVGSVSHQGDSRYALVTLSRAATTSSTSASTIPAWSGIVRRPS